MEEACILPEGGMQLRGNINRDLILDMMVDDCVLICEVDKGVPGRGAGLDEGGLRGRSPTRRVSRAPSMGAKSRGRILLAVKAHLE